MAEAVNSFPVRHVFLRCEWCNGEMPPPLPRGRPRQFCRDHCRLRFWRWLRPTVERLSAGDRWDGRHERWFRSDRSVPCRIHRRGEPFRGFA